MRLAVLVLAVAMAAATAAATAGEDQAMRRRRSIGSWISDFFKKWKKDDSEDDYGGQQIITVPVYQPRPIYHPPVVHKPYYSPPTYGPPAIPPTSYGGGFGGGGQFKGGFGGGGFGGGGHGGGGHIKGGFGGGGPIKGGIGGGSPIKGGFGGGGPIKGGFGGGGPIKGGFGGGGAIKGGFGGGGAIKGGYGGGGFGGGGGHIKGGFGGGGGHIKGGFGGGGGHIKGGFGGGGGHIKGGFGGGGGHIKGGGGGHAKGIPYGFGPVKDSDVVLGGGSYHPPALPAGGYGAPPPLPLDTYAAPVLDDVYGPPKIVDTYSTLAIPKGPVVSPGLGDSYIPPLAPVNDLGGAAGAAHGASSYVDFQPSQLLPIESVVPEVPLAPKGPPAPLSPLYELPGDGSALPPAPIDILPPGNGIFDVGGSKRSIDGGFGSVAGINDQYSAPLTYGAELGYDDPIIEIVFEDGEPAPPLPPPVIDPEVFALPEEPVEVYFIEYSPGDNLDDIAALNLEGAKPGILHDLPDELPIDVRSHLLDSGVLDNAEIQVINLDDALTKGYLDRDTREALEAVYASESRHDEKKVDAPSKEGVNIKVHRLMNEDGTPKGVAELLSSLGKYREGRFAGLVEANDEDKKKFIPVIVDGDKLPLPNHPGLDGREVAGVLVLAPGHKNKTSEPPANTSTPVHNLVESASNPAAAVIDPISERVDRQWNGDPNGWRPVWD